MTSGVGVKAKSSPTGTEPDMDDETRAIPQRAAVVRMLQDGSTGVLLIDVFLVIVFGLVSVNHVFWSQANYTSLLLGIDESLLLSLGLAMLLGAGVFDLSLGANLVLSSVVGAKVMAAISGSSGSHDVFLAIVVGLVACLVAGGLFGLINGFVIAYLRVNSLIGTLGTMGIGTGVAFLLTNGTDITGPPVQLQDKFGIATVWFVPYPALVALGIAILLWGVVRYTRFGLVTLAIGSSRVAALRAGINVRRHLVLLTILAGALAGLAGFFDLSRYLSTAVNGHNDDALAAFTAVVIGGTRLDGGRIRILGVVWGAVLAVVLLSGLVIVGASSFYQLIAIGAILIAVVALDQYRSRGQEPS